MTAAFGLDVVLRPRGGDFLFDDDEFAIMRSDIETAKAEGADGVVIGLLTRAGEVDTVRTRELISLARPLSVTFHRAFDMTREPFDALGALIELGVDRVLTSGQEATVLEGLPMVAELVRRAESRIVVMPGGGITSRNVERIIATGRADAPRCLRMTAVCALAACHSLNFGRRRFPQAVTGASPYDWIRRQPVTQRFAPTDTRGLSLRALFLQFPQLATSSLAVRQEDPPTIAPFGLVRRYTRLARRRDVRRSGLGGQASVL